MDIPLVKVIIYNQCDKCDRTYMMKSNQLCPNCNVFCTKFNKFVIKYDPLPYRYKSSSQLILLCKKI